jgi:hypothetical protein
VVLDVRERFYQSEEDMEFVAAAAALAGFTLAHNGHQIIVLRAPE